MTIEDDNETACDKLIESFTGVLNDLADDGQQHLMVRLSLGPNSQRQALKPRTCSLTIQYPNGR
jgi:hypothetical protein